MKIAVIPARGGSKRIPRKNIKEFCGKPMIAWSIVAALQSGCFDRIVVSTDDTEIAEVAQRLGTEAISLPLYYGLTDSEQDRVIRALREALA